MSCTGNSIRVGISGAPGVGKSTFIETLGLQLCNMDKRVAVLSIDPSSSISGGSILGDKTRMMQLSTHPNAFIRPSPAGRTLGGVASYTRESILLCEAAGFDVVFIETVGVGQSETSISELSDLFLLLLMPSGGDELQGIKRGVVELADMILVNKADGDLVNAAQHTVADYRSALQLLRNRDTVYVQAISAAHNQGIVECWQRIESHWLAAHSNGRLARRRAKQRQSWLDDELRLSITRYVCAWVRDNPQIAAVEAGVANGECSPGSAVNAFLNNITITHHD